MLVLHQYSMHDEITLELYVDPGEYYITLDELKQLPKEQ